MNLAAAVRGYAQGFMRDPPDRELLETLRLDERTVYAQGAADPGVRAAAAKYPVARVWTYNSHPFGYPEDVTGAEPTDELRAWVESAPVDWILTTGDGGVHHTLRMREALGLKSPEQGGPRVAALQVGSFCRNDHVVARQADESIGARVFFPGADLMRFYRDEERAVPFLAPCEPRLVGGAPAPIDWHSAGVSHSPSNPGTKGTDHIWPIAQELCAAAGVEFDMIAGVSAEEARTRRAARPIFVDQFNFHIAGFGQAVTDAMADGCAVVSHVAHLIGEIDGFYPRPPIVHVQTEAHLREHLRRLLADEGERTWRRRASLAWAREVASPVAVAEDWWRHLARWA